MRLDSLSIENCKTVTVSADTCSVCNDGYILTNDGKKCLGAISNCIQYVNSLSNTIVLTCKTCGDTYYLDTIDSVTRCVAGGIDGCLTYTSSTICSACNLAEYYLKDSKCTKHVKVDNCVKYNGINFNECTSCAVGFYPFQLKTVCSPITVISNCISYSDDITCSNCEDTYFILNNKCVSISGTYPNCAIAVKDALSCGACADKYALKNLAADKTCAPNHNYILDLCDNVGSNILFKANNVADIDSCNVCKENAFPFDLSGLFACVSDTLLATRGVTSPVTGCKKYSAELTPVCLQCPMYLKILATGVRSCETTCPPADSTNLLDDLTGNVNTCSPVTGGDTTFQLTNCAVAVKIRTAANAFALSCIKPISTKLPLVATGVVANNPTIWKDLSGSSITRPDDAFLYYGFDISAHGSEANQHDATDLANCELYFIALSGFLLCARCKFSFTTKFTFSSGANYAAGATFVSKCESIEFCDATAKYTGFHSTVNRFLSCHACSSSKFVTVVVGVTNLTAAAGSYSFNSLIASKAAVQCRTPLLTGPATFEAPLKIDNCLVYGWNYHNNSPIDGLPVDPVAASQGCLACKPGYAMTLKIGSAYFGDTCTLITDCDLTKNSMVSRCTFCTQVTAAGVASWKAFEDHKGLVCRLVKTDNCLFFTGPLVADLTNKYNCRICRAGYWLNHDKFCEKITLPQCSEASGATNLYKLPNSPGTIGSWSEATIAEYYALKHLSKANSITGCDTCASGFTGFRMVANEKQCVLSPYVAANVFLATPISYITDCSKYYNDLDTGNAPHATCFACKNNMLPTEDGKLCVAPIAKCLLAQSSPNVTKCKTCETTHVQISGICTIKNIANCLLYDESPSVAELFCSTCNPGFVLTTTKKSCYTGKVTGCDTYDLDFQWACSACSAGYTRITTINSRTYCFKIIDGSNCIELDSTLNGLQGGYFLCNTCEANNSAAYRPKEYTNTDVAKVQSMCSGLNLVDKCLTYDSDIVAVGSNSFLCTSCAVGFWVDEDKNICVARVNQPSGCVLYEKNKDKCKTCSDSTFINETATDCISFPNGILRCASYSNDTVCASCQPPAYLSSNACPLSTVISKCVTYTGNYTCTACDSGYFLTNSTFCESSKATNCYTYTSISACEKCSPLDLNKGLKTDTNGVTSCVDKNVPNCELSTNDFPFKCTQCKKGFYIGPDGECTAATTINNCLVYDSATTCTQCERLSLLAVDRKTCDDTKFAPFNDPNCLDSQILATPICSKCSPGSIFVNSACTACSNNTYENGCFSCDPTNQTNCFACKPGFYQSPDGNCLGSGLANTNTTNNTNMTSNSMVFKLCGLLALLATLLL